MWLIPSPAAEPPKKLDPAAWGSDHVDKAVPEYMTGEECLFCHREKIGPAWPQNRHQSTIREVAGEPGALGSLKASQAHAPFAPLIEFVLGRTNQMRFLKRSDVYGKADMLSTRLRPGAAPLRDAGVPHWDSGTFANRCAGCHATGVDSRAKTFSTLSIDCFACHGVAALDHAKDTTKVLFSKKRNDPARVVVSVCGSCHIRTGHSRSTGLPFPNNFVPGDNLFRDFEVDFSEQALGRLNAIDRHVLQNVRDVVVRGNEDLSCLSCHDVHRTSSWAHRRQRRGEICWSCHRNNMDGLLPHWSKVDSALCGY